jgi:hypothetical protein
MRITPPTPGQLVDVQFLSNLADAINGLDSDYAKSKGQSNVVTNRSGQVRETMDTMGLALEAGYVSVSKDVTKKGDAISVTYSFKNKFKYPPIVTATPQIRTTGADKDVTGISVNIQAVATGSVIIQLVFDAKSGMINIGINIIAVGVPSAT